MKDYLIKKIASGYWMGEAAWAGIPAALIEDYPWRGNYRPHAQAQLAYTGDAFVLYMQALEEEFNMRAEAEEGYCEWVFLDSCMEFFLMPFPDEDKRYLNFEANPNGAFLLGIGEGKERKFLTGKPLEDLRLKAFFERAKPGFMRWGFMLELKFAMIADIFGRCIVPGSAHLRGNFYKCGDRTAKPHYGVWNSIRHIVPEFHRPNDFGLFDFAME